MIQTPFLCLILLKIYRTLFCMSLYIDSLSKFYGTQHVLKNISFHVESGEIIGFLGPNGAGKSTAMKIITGFVQPDSGSIFVDGIDVLNDTLHAQKIIGYLPEHNPLYLDMYVAEYLLFIAQLYKLGKESKQRVEDIIEKTGLTREYAKKIGQLSKGYRQRVGLAQAMIHNPKVLILDEPTTGLDPNQLVEIRELIKEVGKDKTVILSTHIMQEVQAVCDRYVIIREGSIVADSKKDKIHDTMTIVVEFANPISKDQLFMIDKITAIHAINARSYVVECNEDIRYLLYQFAVEQGVGLVTLHLQEQNLEELFRKLTRN